MIPIGTRRTESVAEFSQIVDAVQGNVDYVQPAAFALGLARVALTGQVLDVKFPTVNLNENHGTAAVLAGATSNFELVDEAGALTDPRITYNQLCGAFNAFTGDGKTHDNIDAMHAVFTAEGARPDRYTVRPVLAVIHDLNTPPKNAVDAWFRLNLLSTRKVRPHGVNLDGMFGLMTNVAWTNEGPILPDQVDKVRAQLMRQDRDLIVRGLDKFPRMLDYVRPPSGVRIADADRVRLGAHLAEGTTVMHEGFVNFNAGTVAPVKEGDEKRVMVEGRISAGVVVGNNTDIGGGASIMGTLSGGGKEVISIGEGCLLGANSGIGISLGENCAVEAGLYVTFGTKVSIDGEIRKASELSGSSGLVFRRNSQTGIVEAVPRRGATVVLSSMLHKN